MALDIFVPESSPDDAIVGPLHSVTWVTNDRAGVTAALCSGYSLTNGDWQRPDEDNATALNTYFGFNAEENWDVRCFSMENTGDNVAIRVISPESKVATVRPAHEGLYKGGATISAPMADLREHEQKMAALNIHSTIGVKEMEFQSPTGEVYISAEIAYKGPDNIFLLGVKRPDVFVPVGPINDEEGIGGPAYSARCITETDKTLEFFETVLGYEIRRDVELTVGERSAINMPEGTVERFVQGFASGASSGYVVFMDHGAATKLSDVRNYGPPSAGIVLWTFPTAQLDTVYQLAVEFGAEILHPPEQRDIPGLPSTRTFVVRDPDGFPIEFFEEASATGQDT